MPLTVKPRNSSSPNFAAEITGIDLSRPVADDVLAEIIAIMDVYAVGVFPGQKVTDEQQVAFSERLGPVRPSRKNLRPGYQHRIDMRLSDVSNLTPVNEVRERDDYYRLSDLGNRLWHTDSSFKATPAMYSLLSARIVPSWGGETQFADLRADYDALPVFKMKEIEDMIAMHAIMYSREKVGFTDFMQLERDLQPPVPQLIVRTHPGSGRKTLYLAAHAGEVVGMPMPEGRILLLDLIDHATQPQFVYTHNWNVDDLVIWDDRCTMHRAREFDMDEVRDMRRATVQDVAPTIEQEKAA